MSKQKTPKKELKRSKGRTLLVVGLCAVAVLYCSLVQCLSALDANSGGAARRSQIAMHHESESGPLATVFGVHRDKRDGESDTAQSSATWIPFGTSVVTSQRYGYSGREVSSITGDLYYRNRNYNPKLGRFTGRDPMLYGPDINLYGYVANKPYAYVDPYGLELQIWGADPFRENIRKALLTLCNGLKFTELGDDDTKVEMESCPPRNDALCYGLYEITKNPQKNIIGQQYDPDEFDIQTKHTAGERIELPDGTFKPGLRDRAIIFLKNKNLQSTQNNYKSIDPRYSIPNPLPLPWAVALAHELGHMHHVNYGTHPVASLDRELAEQKSLDWENRAWQKINSPVRRKKYGY